MHRPGDRHARALSEQVAGAVITGGQRDRPNAIVSGDGTTERTCRLFTVAEIYRLGLVDRVAAGAQIAEGVCAVVIRDRGQVDGSTKIVGTTELHGYTWDCRFTAVPRSVVVAVQIHRATDLCWTQFAEVVARA